jgi:hypothetical protein
VDVLENSKFHTAAVSQTQDPPARRLVAVLTGKAVFQLVRLRGGFQDFRVHILFVMGFVNVVLILFSCALYFPHSLYT